jgi:hypothetical protein
LRKNKAQLAKVISTEMGKIFSEAEAEIEKCAHEADWYAEHGPKIMADEPAPTGTVNAYVSYLPLGPILAIMPWNFPIWQLTRMAIPTMLAGNVVLVKHSPNTQRSSLEFERVMLEAGFPTDRAHGTAISRWHAGTGDLAKGNLGGRLQRDDHEIPLLDSIAKLVQLRGEVQLSLRFTRHLLLKVAFARTRGEPWPGPGRLSL